MVEGSIAGVMMWAMLSGDGSTVTPGAVVSPEAEFLLRQCRMECIGQTMRMCLVFPLQLGRIPMIEVGHHACA